MKQIFLLVFVIALFLYSCSPQIERIKHKQYSNKDTAECKVKIDFDNYLMSKSKAISTMIFSSNIMTTNCSKESFLDTIKAEACQIGANFVNVYNIDEPSIINPCYRAFADFYLIDTSIFEKKDTVKAYDYRNEIVPALSQKYPMPKQEILLLFGYNAYEKDSYLKLVNDLSKSLFNQSFPFEFGYNFGIDYTYWIDDLGLNTGYDYLPYLLSPETERYSMSVSINKLGCSVNINTSQKVSEEMRRFFIRGGLNYSMLRINGGKISGDLLGEGMGLYCEIGSFWGFHKNLILEGIMGFETTNYKIPTLDNNYSFYKIYLLTSFGFALR